MQQKAKIIDTTREEKSQILQERLKAEIKKLGYTQEKVANEVGISPSSISKYLKGNGFPDQITLEALAKLFNVEPNYLIGKNECPNYKYEDITEKTGLSQKAIAKLYQLQHDYYLFEDIEVDIEEKRGRTIQHREHINVLNSIIENGTYLFWVLDSILKYKLKKEELANTKEKIKIFDLNEEIEDLENKIQRRFLRIVREIV